MISDTAPTENKLSSDDITKQANTKLRESFLNAINELYGQKCSILTYEQTRLTGSFTGWKMDGIEVLLRDLQTPAGIKMTAALVRTPDIISIEFDNPIPLP